MDTCQDCVIDLADIDISEGYPEYGIHIIDSSGIDITRSYVYGSYMGYYEYGYPLDTFGMLGAIDDIVSFGILIEASDYVLVNDCQIGQFDAGVGISGSNEINVSFSTISDCYTNGIIMNDLGAGRDTPGT